MCPKGSLDPPPRILERKHGEAISKEQTGRVGKEAAGRDHHAPLAQRSWLAQDPRRLLHGGHQTHTRQCRRQTGKKYFLQAFFFAFHEKAAKIISLFHP